MSVNRDWQSLHFLKVDSLYENNQKLWSKQQITKQEIQFIVVVEMRYAFFFELGTEFLNVI
jgi:hypothetical protein